MAKLENESNGGKFSTGRNHAVMTRNEALLTMGAMTASALLPGLAVDDLSTSRLWTTQDEDKTLNHPLLSKAVSELEYLTPADKFIVQRRGKLVLTEIPSEKLAAIGLTHETWKLEILPDPESNSELGNPLTIAQPLPRPFGRSGVNVIEVAKFTVEVK